MKRIIGSGRIVQSGIFHSKQTQIRSQFMLSSMNRHLYRYQSTNTSPNQQQQQPTVIVQSSNNNDNINVHEKHRARTIDTIQIILSGADYNSHQIKHPHSEESLRQAQNEQNGKKVTDANLKEDYVMPHSIWTQEDLKNVQITHEPCVKISDYLAYATVQTLRFTWDISTGYFFKQKLGIGKFDRRKWLLRLCYLETVAGVPGMMFGMVRHLNSLRRMERDGGWINMLLAEAENERMHLLTFLKLYKPGKPFRYAVVTAQGIFSNYLFMAYMISPRYCHRFVGYLEQEAVKTYTQLLKDIDDGKLPEFEEECDAIAKQYWQLPDGATWRDVFEQVRCDEVNHRDVNHTLAPLSKNQPNPFRYNK